MSSTIKSAAATTRYDKPVIDFIEIDGVMIRYAARVGAPDKPPILLFNGIGANLEITFPFIDEMTGREILVFDIPGTGRSGMWLRPRRFPGIAKLANKLLDRLGYRRVDVAGISWGGALAQQFAHQYPDRARRLVLAATMAGVVSIPGKPRVLSIMTTPRRYLSARYMMDTAPVIYGGESRDKPKLIRQHTARVIAPTFRGYLYQLLAGSAWTSAFWLHRLKQPTLILAGDDDPLVPAVNARFMSMLIPDNELHIIKNGGHLFLLHRAEKLVPLISDFLDAPRAKPGR